MRVMRGIDGIDQYVPTYEWTSSHPFMRLSRLSRACLVRTHEIDDMVAGSAKQKLCVEAPTNSTARVRSWLLVGDTAPRPVV